MLEITRGRVKPIDRGSGPYPERPEAEPGPIDRALIEAYGRIAAKFQRGVRALSQRVPQIEAHATDFTGRPDAALREAVENLRRLLRREGFHPDLVARSFALVREVSGRQLGMPHYPVQLMGGWVLMEGRLAEMATGEGKTLTASLAAATAALGGRPTHVVTVNDYLAERDAEHMRPLYEALGLTVGCVRHGQSPAERRAAYACDITYGVNKEIAFDYLRDRLALGRRRKLANVMIDRLNSKSATEPLLLRGLYFAIVDEADSIFIDEARTPLVISGAPGEAGDDATYVTALALAEGLTPDTDFTLAATGRSVRLTDGGSDKLRAKTDGQGGIWAARRGREELVRQALAARHLYHRDQHYIVANGKVQIVDEFTGRIADGRQWQNGLHQLIEVKEGCMLSPRNETQASITYQRFFRRYLHLSGMSGTIAETAAELRAVYGLEVVRIPTHKPSRRVDIGTRLYRHAKQKRRAIVAAASAQRAKDRPVLIGTRSVSESEQLGAEFSAEGIEHVVLNARQDRHEADIVSEAGQPGRITVATSMAGRGTDIKLAPGVAERGGLHVILSEFSESIRVDRQLIGRGGRNGDPSTFEAIVALDDQLFTSCAARVAALLAKLLPQGEGPFAPRWTALLRRIAQQSAERLGYRMRRDTLRMQRQLDKALGFAGRD